MRKIALSLGFLSTAALLTGCWSQSPAPVEKEGASSSVVAINDSAPAMQFVTYEGTVRLPSDGGPYYELDRGDGLTVFAVSSTIDMDALVGTMVRVSGNASLGPDGLHVLIDVTSVSDLTPDLEPEILTEDDEESSSSEEAVEVAEEIPESSSSIASSTAPMSSSSRRSSSVASVSSKAAASSVSSVLGDNTGTERETAMKKHAVDSSLFSQTYCSTHVGFCIKLHKNWYYQSFGVNVPPSLWHVEIGPEPVENVGDGVMIFTLQAGDMPEGTEGKAVSHGDYVVVYRQWTGGKHFEISAPTSLTAAAEQVAASLTVYQDGQ